MEKTAFHLEQLIDPVCPKEFLDHYWEEKYLHIDRNAPGFYDSLFSIEDVDRWIMLTRTGNANSVTITPPEGAQEGSKYYRPRDIDIDKIYNYFANGHSIVLNHLEDSWLPLSRTVEQLGQLFCAEVGVNAYLTPQGSKTFPIHVDDHDVLILHVYGEKTWYLHAFEQLPVMRLEYSSDLIFNDSWGPERLKSPLLGELRLQPGDLLYIPRGMPHRAMAKDAPSLHLTVSIIPLYWTDFLKAAVEQASVHTQALRRALPVGFVNDPAAHEAMRHQFKVAFQAFEENCSFDEILRVVRKNRVRSQGYPRDGHFGHLTQLQKISVASTVAKRSSILCVAEFSDHHSSLRFGLRYVRGPMHLRRAMEFICDHESFKVADLPSLDDQGKVVLVRRLVREGLLRLMVL